MRIFHVAKQSHATPPFPLLTHMTVLPLSCCFSPPGEHKIREREAVVQEVVHPVQVEEVQPVIHRDRIETEVHQVYAPCHMSTVKSAFSLFRFSSVSTLLFPFHYHSASGNVHLLTPVSFFFVT